MDYLDFSKKNEDTNHEYLLLFQEDLENAAKNIYNHLSNADLFISDFLGYPQMYVVYSFTFKTTATSLKKFYKSMAEHGKIEKKDYDHVCHDIKESCESYNNPHLPF